VVVDISSFWKYSSSQMVMVNLSFAYYWSNQLHVILMHQLKLDLNWNGTIIIVDQT
jgi:hypothetical protein